MEKQKNERGAGRKPLPKEEKGVRFSGGMLPPELYAWVMEGIEGLKGMALVKAALEFYRQHHAP